VAMLRLGLNLNEFKAMTVMPEDFDEFWAEGRAELAKIPVQKVYESRIK